MFICLFFLFSCVCFQSAIFLEYLDFVLDKTEEYSRTPHEDSHTELASEFIYGCRCLSILHRNPEWGSKLVEKGEQNFMTKALTLQTKNEETVCQLVVQTILDALQPNKSLAVLWVTKNDEDIANVVVGLIERLHQSIAPFSDLRKVEGLMIQRLQLMEIIARNNTEVSKSSPDYAKTSRTYFNDTNAFSVLIDLWSGWKTKKYSDQTLMHIMRAIRWIYNDKWIPVIIEVRSCVQNCV